MKKTILFALLVAHVATFAQVNSEKSAPVERKFHSSGYGSLTSHYSKFNGQDAVFAGAFGGWMINHKMMIGLAGYGLVTNHEGYGLDGDMNSDNKLKMGYGGLMLEYTFLENKRVHVSTNVLLGAGGVVNAHYHDIPDSYGDTWHSDEESGFRVLQPSVSIETDVTPWFRVAVGGGYRYIWGADMSGITNQKMSAPTANLSLKFGVF